MSTNFTPRTMFEKIWDDHVVHAEAGKQTILYIDLHLVHEVTSPQAFEGLRLAGRKVRRPERTVATVDHNVPTTDRSLPIADPIAKQQIDTLRQNCRQFGVRLYDLDDRNQGIVHVIGPELGLTQPGMTIVCGDSHTATHGAFGRLGLRHRHQRSRARAGHADALAAQAQDAGNPHRRPPGRRRDRQGPDPLAHRPDLHQRRRPATASSTPARPIRSLSMEERMTVCNMSIEAGARAGMIAPDETTFDYLRRPALCAAGFRRRRRALEDSCPAIPARSYDRAEIFDAAEIEPQVTWGTNPGQVVDVGGRVPDPADLANADRPQGGRGGAWRTWALKPATPIVDIPIDRVFIGSCTNGRIEDLRAAAAVVRGHHVADGVEAMVVPGSGLVKRQAEAEGLDKIFTAAGLDWREAGCSMCLAMNPDKLEPGERCAATSNRNFEGRQGKGGRTHLVSPAMAAAAAVAGHFVDIDAASGSTR